MPAYADLDALLADVDAVSFSVPPDVQVRKVDLAVELQILSFYQQRRTAAAAIG